jgi:predicted nucleic acid-binding protein
VAVAGWILDKSAAARASDPAIGPLLEELSGHLYMCEVGELEQLYSALSARDYDERKSAIQTDFDVLPAPADLLYRALSLQRDLAHHHGMWHRTPIPDLLIAETALHHEVGVVHVDAHFDRIAEIRPLVVRRLA